MWRHLTWLWVVGVLIIATQTHAADQSASTDLKGGDFYAARTHADIASFDGALIACRAGLIIGGFLESGDTAVESLHEALIACDKAVILNPASLDARLSLAMAIGFEGKRKTSPKLAKLSRTIITRTLELYPENAMAIGALAGWHAEVSRAGFMARMALGARPSKARDGFNRATNLAPENIAIQFEYLKFLAFSGKKYQQDAVNVARRILATTPSEAILAHMQTLTQDIQAALKTGRTKDMAAAAHKASAFGDIKQWKRLPAFDTDSLKSLDLILKD